jgi:hypothetical protein
MVNFLLLAAGASPVAASSSGAPGERTSRFANPSYLERDSENSNLVIEPMNTSAPTTRRPPWLPGPSILSTIRAWQGEEPCPLPDEEPQAGNKVRFAPGAWDGIATHHLGRASEHDEARHVLTTVETLARLVRDDSDEARVSLYQLYLGDTVSPHADALVEEIRRQQELGPEELRPHARWLVEHAAHREPLKLGIVLLGLCGSEDDLDALQELARHDEFTLFCAVVVGNLLADPVDVIWQMAQRVHGWGKVQLVERLAGEVEDRPDIQVWLLRHGCKNTIMPEYLAFACATGGRLIEVLSADQVDDELLDGARLIVQALLCGGPAEDIDAYPDGFLAVRYMVSLLESRCNSLVRLGTVRQIHDWLEWPEKPPMPEHLKALFADQGEKEPQRDIWLERAERGWTDELRAQLTEACQEIMRRPEWPGRVREGHRSGDPLEQHRAWHLAQVVGVDLWEDELARLVSDPLDAGLYCNLLRTDDLGRVRRVVAFAEENLPLGEIASGPADELGLGPAFRPHSCLVMVLQELRRPGVFSSKLVLAGLRSPVVNNRNWAINALESQPVEKWGPEVIQVLGQAVAEEPRDDVRERMRSLVERAGDAPKG